MTLKYSFLKSVISVLFFSSEQMNLPNTDYIDINYPQQRGGGTRQPRQAMVLT